MVPVLCPSGLSLSLFFFFSSSTTLLKPTHLPPPSCTHAQSCNPMDCSPPGSSVRGLSQARILEWVAISFSISGLSLMSLLTDWSLREKSDMVRLTWRTWPGLGPCVFSFSPLHGRVLSGRWEERWGGRVAPGEGFSSLQL